MIRTLLGSALGLLAGVALGCLAAFLLQPPPPSEAGWTTYPTLADAANAFAQSRERQVAGPSARSLYFTGCLFGGGFGAVVGAVAGATGAVLRALRKPGLGP